MATAVELVIEELASVGFSQLARPLKVAGAEFEFETALLGTGVSHDLVLIASGEVPNSRLVRLSEGLSRILDHANSTRPVTLIHVGEPPSLDDQDRLERNLRLLMIQNRDADRDQVRRAIAVLLPLKLPSDHQAKKEPLTEVVKALGTTATEQHLILVGASAEGEEAVMEALKGFIDDVFVGDEDELRTP